MEATVFNFQETPYGLFTLGELRTEGNISKAASREFPTAIPLLTKEWVIGFDERSQVVGRERQKNE